MRAPGTMTLMTLGPKASPGLARASGSWSLRMPGQAGRAGNSFHGQKQVPPLACETPVLRSGEPSGSAPLGVRQPGKGCGSPRELSCGLSTCCLDHAAARAARVSPSCIVDQLWSGWAVFVVFVLAFYVAGERVVLPVGEVKLLKSSCGGYRKSLPS